MLTYPDLSHYQQHVHQQLTNDYELSDAEALQLMSQELSTVKECEFSAIRSAGCASRLFKVYQNEKFNTPIYTVLNGHYSPATAYIQECVPHHLPEMHLYTRMRCWIEISDKKQSKGAERYCWQFAKDLDWMKEYNKVCLKHSKTLIRNAIEACKEVSYNGPWTIPKHTTWSALVVMYRDEKLNMVTQTCLQITGDVEKFCYIKNTFLPHLDDIGRRNYEQAEALSRKYFNTHWEMAESGQ